MVQYKKEALKNKYFFCYLLSIKMSEKTLKFNNIRFNKKELHKPKKPIDLTSVNVDQIVASEGYKYFICYQENEIVKALFIIFPQMSGYIK